MPRNLLPALVLFGVVCVGAVLWRQVEGESASQSADSQVEPVENVFDARVSENGDSFDVSAPDAGVMDGMVTRVPMPAHRAPAELQGVEEAARRQLADRQLEHLRRMAELAEQGSDPERARLMRARIEALEKARRAGAAP